MRKTTVALVLLLAVVLSGCSKPLSPKLGIGYKECKAKGGRLVLETRYTSPVWNKKVRTCLKGGIAE